MAANDFLGPLCKYFETSVLSASSMLIKRLKDYVMMVARQPVKKQLKRFQSPTVIISRTGAFNVVPSFHQVEEKLMISFTPQWKGQCNSFSRRLLQESGVLIFGYRLV